MNSRAPYLSIVATSRNDDHGGSLLRRTQTFINALADQVKRYDIPAELIMVEWNPPPDRGPLHEALQWPPDPGPLQVRFIQVPPAVHAQYRHAEALPLYQMIAKNVGIRRARGRYVLATNIDILFSNELMEFIAAGALQPGFMYRLDRHDVMTDVPMDADVDSRLDYCKSHIVRLNNREGTFPVTPHGEHTIAPRDIVEPSSGISLGPGWYPAEYGSGQAARWVENDAVLSLTPATEPPPPLVLEIEPGPSIPANFFELLFVDEADRVVTRAEVRGRSVIQLQVPAGGTRSLRLRTPDGGHPIRYNPRILNFRVYRCGWGETAATEEALPQEPAIQEAAPQEPAIQETAPQEPAMQDAPPPVDPLPEGNPLPEVTETESAPIPPAAEPVPVVAAIENTAYKVISAEPVEERSSGMPSGVFGKVAGVLRRAAEEGPVITVWVPVPGAVRRGLRFCFHLAGRSISDPAPPATESARVEAIAPPVIVEAIEPLCAAAATAPATMAPDPEPPAAVEPAPEPIPMAEAVKEAPAPEQLAPAMTTAPPQLRTPSRGLLRPQDDPSSDYYYQPANLHTNGCGDFTLLAKEHWMDLRGYPEFDMYSFHIDSVFCFAAHHAGAREVVLKDPMRMYHIEHGRGSGWTPEGENDLFNRLRAKGVPWLEYSEVITWAAQMRRLESPLIFNGEHWGLRDVDLPEIAF